VEVSSASKIGIMRLILIQKKIKKQEIRDETNENELKISPGSRSKM
jgi:hypothetical protein